MLKKQEGSTTKRKETQYVYKLDSNTLTTL